ncbi:MAG: DUF1349 domain-containing protein [Pirellulales bacterium]|nr:DUF1349 domain-containing protein [Pirellulales bacterium]
MKQQQKLGKVQRRRNHSEIRRWLRNGRYSRIEPLEPRIVLSHNGNNAYLFAMPEDLMAEANANAAAGGALSASPFPNITWTTLANGMPILSSDPSAPATIFLDFDGDPGDSETAATDPYDINGSPSTFNATEQSNIVETWRQVSIYFAMFNVNVTTIQPNVNLVPTAWIAIGNNIAGAYSGVNVFNNTTPQSFQSSVDITGRISATAHELGHNFGSWHIAGYDNLGKKIAEYHDAFDPLHGPIMGLDYQGVIHKWYAWHDSTDVATLQDDMARIAADLDNYGGDGYRPDDFGGTIATAAPLVAVGNTQAKVGIIERLTDADAFSFASTGGRYAIMVGRDAPSGVDVKMSVYDSTGALLAVDDGDPRKQPYTMVNDSHLTLDLPAGTFYVIVQSHGNYGDQGQYIVRVDPLPSGWSAQGVGLVGIPGYVNYDATTDKYIVGGSGSDISSTADSFHYLYQTLTGDGSITVRVDSQGDTHGSAKAGVMIRESLAENARSAMVLVKPGNSSFFQYRSSTGGSTTSINGPIGSTAKWLRLTRTGNTFKAEVSTNGTTWNQVGSIQTVNMAATAYIGLATTSHNNIRLSTATYSNLSVTGNLNVPPVLNDLAAPVDLAVTSASTNTVELSWEALVLLGDVNGDGVVDNTDLNMVKANFGNFGAAGAPADANHDGVVDILDYNIVKNSLGSAPIGYAVERSTDNVNFVQIGVTASGVTTYADTGLSEDLQYFYRLRTRGSAAVSTPSSIVSASTRAGAISRLNVISYTDKQLILDWTDASGETSYRVERSLDGATGWTALTTLGKNVPMYVNGGLSAGTKYYYRVVTVDALGDAATSGIASGFTRLSAVGNLQFTNQAANQMAISWNAATGATSYKVEQSSDNTNWTTVSSSQTGLTYADNSVTPVNKYYYRVTALNASVPGVSATIFAASPAGEALPSLWTSTDIGINTTGGARTGAVGVSGGTVTIIGAGTDIWNSNDQFRFTYVSLSGNATVTARVVSVENTDYYARGGVMIRSSTATSSKFASMMGQPSDASIRAQRRTSTGGGAAEVAYGTAVTVPYWVRVSRSGSTFTSQLSADGVTWETLDTRMFSNFGTAVLYGLALTPRDYTNSLMNKVVFDNVSVTSGSTTITLSSPAAAAGAVANSSASAAAGNSAASTGAKGNLPRNPTSIRSIVSALDELSRHSKDKKLVARIASLRLSMVDEHNRSSAKHHHRSAVDRELMSWLDERGGRRTLDSLACAMKSERGHDAFFLVLGRQS